MRTLILCLALALTGCASSPSHTVLGWQALAHGNYSTAEATIREAIQRGEHPDINWLNLGLLYHAQAMQSEATKPVMLRRSLAALTMAARYGQPRAQFILTKEGQPVPPADLVKHDADDSGLAALALVGAVAALNRHTAAPAPSLMMPVSMPVNCTSTGMGNIVRTECR